jgi:hypothetical protein
MSSPFPIEIENANNWLKIFGLVPEGNLYSGQPLFRLRRAEEEYEMRFGEFNLFYGSIFIKTEKGVRETLKYPFLPKTWILEQWWPPQKYFNRELPDSVNGGYDIVFVFADKKDNPLPFNKKVLEIFMGQRMLPGATPEQRRIHYKNLQEIRDKEEEAYFMEVTEDNGRGSVGEADLVHVGSGIFTDFSTSDIQNVLKRKDQQLGNNR